MFLTLWTYVCPPQQDKSPKPPKSPKSFWVRKQVVGGGAAFVAVLALSQVVQGLALRVSCSTPLGLPTAIGETFFFLRLICIGFSSYFLNQTLSILWWFVRIDLLLN